MKGGKKIYRKGEKVKRTRQKQEETKKKKKKHTHTHENRSGTKRLGPKMQEHVR